MNAILEFLRLSERTGLPPMILLTALSAMMADAKACNARAVYREIQPDPAEILRQVGELRRSVAKLQGKVASLERANKRRDIMENAAIADPDGVMMAITEEVGRETSFSVAELRGRRRHHHLALARHTAMNRCRAAGKTLAKVAAFFGVDHTSVIYAEHRMGAK